MRAQDIWAQGGFVVYKKGGEGLDEVYASLATHPEGKIKARQRIERVEIETALDEVDAARVTFIDAERVWTKYFAELYQSGKLQEEIWTVKIGYHFQPEDQWATFSGIPMMETVEFPRNQPPRVTVRLFSAAVALQRGNSAQSGAKSRHWLFGPNEPPQVKRALQEMASFYGLSLDLGKDVEKVLDILDEHFKNYDSDTTAYLHEEWAHGPTWPWEHVLFVALPEYVRAMEQLNRAVSTRVVGKPRDMSDWDYLLVIRNAIQPILSQMKQDEQTAGITDAFWSAVSKAGNRIIIGVEQKKLIFKTLRDFIPDIDKIAVFSYQTLDHTLFDFRVTGRLSTSGTNILSLMSQLFGRRSGNLVEVETAPTLTKVEGGADSPEMRYRVGPSDPKEGDPTILGKKQFFRLSPVSSRTEWVKAANEEILGMLNTNLSAQATLVGAPFLRAGKLMGTYGLGFSPDTTPDLSKPSVLASLDRVWLVTRCTHSVDASGFYTTEVELAGALSDDSAKKVRNIEQVAGALLGRIAGGVEGPPSNVRPAILEIFGL